jgi:hypothetical protein
LSSPPVVLDLTLGAVMCILFVMDLKISRDSLTPS